MEKHEPLAGLQEELQRTPICMVQFGAGSCAPCAAIRRKLEQWNEAHPAVRFLYVPVEDFPREAAEQGVFSVPAVLLYVEGKLTLRESGYFSVEEFLRRTGRLLALLEE